MASLLQEVLFETRGQAPAPSKDFCQLLVTRRQVIFRWWKISLRSESRESRPGATYASHEDFLQNSSLQNIILFTRRQRRSAFLRSFLHVSYALLIKILHFLQHNQEIFSPVQIAIVFGANILEHVFNLCQGKYDLLERLPVALLVYIISFLDLEDIARLSQVSRKLKMVCNSNALWENIVKNLCDTITPEMKELAQEIGWKQFFFTNKLQLQVQLRRRRQKQDAQNKNLTE